MVRLPQHLLSLLLISIGLQAGALNAATVYWVEGGSPARLMRADSAGTHQQVVTPLPGWGPFTAIAVNWPEGKIYYSAGFANQMWEINVNGENNQPLDIEGFQGAEHIAMDLPSQTLFFSLGNRLESLAPNDHMPQNLLFGEAMKDLAVESVAQLIYWGEYHVEVQWCKDLKKAPCYCLHRAEMDGSDATSLHCESTIESFREVEVHSSLQRVYWLNPAQSEIRSSNMDGSDVQVVLDILDGVVQTETFALDPFRDKIYWIRFWHGSGFWFHEADLDGTNPRPVFQVATVATARSMGLDPRPSGDIDFDAKVDLTDFARFQNCMGSDYSGHASACAFFDVNLEDTNLGGEDLAGFVSAMNGP